MLPPGLVHYSSQHSSAISVKPFLNELSQRPCVVHPYSNMNTSGGWKKCFILSDKSDFHMIDHLSIAVHAFTSRALLTFSVDKTLPPSELVL